MAGCAFAVIAMPSIASAQEAVNYGSISGRITDPTGAVIEGAAVAVHQAETNRTSNVVTDREGFRARTLRFSI